MIYAECHHCGRMIKINEYGNWVHEGSDLADCFPSSFAEPALGTVHENDDPN